MWLVLYSWSLVFKLTVSILLLLISSFPLNGHSAWKKTMNEWASLLPVLTNKHTNQALLTRGRCLHGLHSSSLAALFPWRKLLLESEICCPCNSLYWNSIYPLKLVSNSTESLKTSLITKDRKSLLPSDSNSVFVCGKLMFIWYMLIYVIFINALKYPQTLVTLNP